MTNVLRLSDDEVKELRRQMKDNDDHKSALAVSVNYKIEQLERQVLLRTQGKKQ